MKSNAAFDREEKRLKAELAKLPQKKWEALLPIPFLALCAFLIPGIPGKNNRPSMAESMGYWEAFTSISIIFILVLPFMIYSHIQKVNNEIFDVEQQLRRLKYKRKEAEEIQASAANNMNPVCDTEQNSV